MIDPLFKGVLANLIESLREVYKDSGEDTPVCNEKELNELSDCMMRAYSGYYSTPQERICNVLFNITKGHYLHNGNKRAAVILAVVAYYNEFNRLDVNIDALTDIVLNVASGEVSKEELLGLIKETDI